VETIRTIMRTFGALRATVDLVPLASVIHDHIFLWLRRVLESLPVQQKNTFKYLSALYPLSLGPFLRWRNMDNLRKAKVAKVPTVDQPAVEEVWVPELSMFLGQKHRLLEQNRLTEKMSYSDYASYCRDREESFLRSQGKQKPKVFQAALIKLCPAADKALSTDVVQLLGYLAKDRVGLITEVMTASGDLSKAGVHTAIGVVDRLFPTPPTKPETKRSRKEPSAARATKRKST